ncbi:MAG: DUF3857 domain-containing protein [Candidatus Omnitrophica bacterium]|nr:DUF3857 domain-containing protein [Candidatus Omnitrophota bacterium]
MINRRIIILIAVSFIIFACEFYSDFNRAKDYTKRAEIFYQKAIKEYQNLIKKNKQTSKLYFELGKLYFDHGDYPKAIEAFKNCDLIEAKKYLGISFYKSGDLTEALKIFDSLGIIPDNFYLYHYGLVCEDLNLYDQAKSIYEKISNSSYKKLAQERISKIDKIFKEGFSDNLVKFFDKKFSKEYYPDAAVLFLHIEEELQVNSDNTSVYTAYFIIKILDEEGKQDFSEVIINYDSTYEKPYLEFARTVKDDGTFTCVGKKHIRDVSRYLDYPLYSNARALILSMPEVEIGSIIEYKFKIFKNQLIDKKYFSLGYFLQEDNPILEAKFSVIVPESMALNIKFLNENYNNFSAELNPQVIKESKNIKYIWIFKEIPQILPEAYMPTVVKINPTILISNFSSWQQIYNWWWNSTKDKIKATESIKQTVQRLIRNKKTDYEKAEAIYNFCARNIRYVAVVYGQAGYQPHSAEEIFLNKYGDCKDQSILLVTMFREAGLEAYPVLIGTEDYFDLYPEFPSILFNHCIVMVKIKGEPIFSDPTCSTCSFSDLPLADQARKVLVFKDDGFQIIQTPSFPYTHNRLELFLKLNLDNQGNIKGEKKVIPFGFYNHAQRFLFLYTQPQLIRERLEEAIQEFSIDAKLYNYRTENLEEISKPLILDYNFEGSLFWISAGNLKILPQLAFIDTTLVAKQSRNYPIDLGVLDMEERNIEIKTPPSFKIKYLPQNIHLDSKWLEFLVEYKFTKGTLYFRQKRIFKTKMIPAEEYLEFKKFYQEILKAVKERVVLEEVN